MHPTNSMFTTGNTEIKFLNLPISRQHQLDFKDEAEQRTFFNQRVGKTFQGAKFQRRKETLKVEAYIDDLLQYNYGFYENKYNGYTKRFYFFIDGKTMVNERISIVQMSIDVFQTWLFDFELKQSFVKKCHVKNDTFGQHTIQEGFETGEYIVAKNGLVTDEELTKELALVCGVSDVEGLSVGGKYSGMYQGVRYWACSLSNSVNMTTFLNKLCEDGKADAIVNLFVVPACLCRGGYNNIGGYLDYNQANCFNHSLEIQMQKEFQFYTPKNNKLYCYPFNALKVYTDDGNNIVLHYENFDKNLLDGDKISFSVDGVLSAGAKFVCTPRDYNKKNYSYIDGIDLGSFPQCSWANDVYANWLALNSNTLRAQSENLTNSYNTSVKNASASYATGKENKEINLATATVSSVVSGITSLLMLNGGGVANSIMSGANAYANSITTQNDLDTSYANTMRSSNTSFENEISMLCAQVADHSLQPNTAKGDTSSCGLDVVRKTHTFYFEQMQIKPEYAQLIDNLFQMYGYTVNSVEVPDFKSRKLWNYVQTVGCNITGAIPQEDIIELKNIFDTGITVWHNKDIKNMFNYQRVNEVVEN